MGKGKWAVAVLVLAGAGIWWGLRSDDRSRRPMQALPQNLDPAVLADVGRAYGRDVQPLFKAACFDCHTTQTVWPWYHAIPGVRQFIEGHVEEGRKALDMTKGFPFDSGSHLLKDLRRVAGNVQRGEMPLRSYQWMHPDSRLTDAQRGVIVHWAQDSFDRLTSTALDAVAPLAPAGVSGSALALPAASASH